MNKDRANNSSAHSYDAIVIDAGLCGIVFLKYALDQKLRCLALEKQQDVGGIWNWLPSWQDIQNRKADFALNDVPLHGVNQPAVHEFAREWVGKYDLNPFIKLQCEVTSVSRREKRWSVRTNQGEFQADYLIVASGIQSEPRIPQIDRKKSEIREMHSARLRQPENLRGKRVTVVGGGASSFDMLDLAIRHGAKDIHWVYRHIKWFLPTKGTKQAAWPNLRELAVVHNILKSAKKVSAFMRWQLKMKFGSELAAIKPKEPFDIQKYQLVPGRSLMLQNLGAISRHHSAIQQLQGREITLATGEHFNTDIILWGTGYRMNLAYLGLPEYSHTESVKELYPKLGSLIRSIDYPNMFFIGMSLIESNSATPFLAAIEAKSIVSHIQNKCEIPINYTPYHIDYWDLFRYCAKFDHANYPRFWWRIKYFLLALWYAVLRNRSVTV